MICASCRGDWSLGEGEREWYEARGLYLPQRCRPCREQRRGVIEGPRESGSIVRVSAADGFGMIAADDGGELFFRLHDVKGLEPRLGVAVTFELATRASGRRPRAWRIRPKEGHP